MQTTEYINKKLDKQLIVFFFVLSLCLFLYDRSVIYIIFANHSPICFPHKHLLTCVLHEYSFNIDGWT